MDDHLLVGASIELTLPLSDQLIHLSSETLVQMIPEIMVTLLTNLAAGAHYRQDCCRVVSHLAGYAIDPVSNPRARTEETLKSVVSPLLKPLLTMNFDSPSFLSEGSAWCLIPLIESEIWKYAPDTLVDQVFEKVAGAVKDRGSRTIGHIKLSCALIRTNGFVAEAYSRLFFTAALDVFQQGGSSEERFLAKEMVDSLIEAGLVVVDDDKLFLFEEEENFGNGDEGEDEERESFAFDKDNFSSQNSCYGGNEQDCDCLISGEDNGELVIRDDSLHELDLKNESMSVVTGQPVTSLRLKNRFLGLPLIVLAVSIPVALLVMANYERNGGFEGLPAT